VSDKKFRETRIGLVDGKPTVYPIVADTKPPHIFSPDEQLILEALFEDAEVRRRKSAHARTCVDVILELAGTPQRRQQVLAGIRDEFAVVEHGGPNVVPIIQKRRKP
jgi:hypothetical protein